MLALVAVLPRLAWVPDNEMAPSLLAGDLIVLLPVAPQAGDVVAIVDPLDPARWTLRRVEAIGGALRYEEGTVYSSAGPVATREMGRDEAHVTMSEGDHLIRVATRGVRWELEEVGVPDEAAYLVADARDEAVDSRWWGPLPLDAVQGVVALRVGAPRHAWRGCADTAP